MDPIHIKGYYSSRIGMGPSAEGCKDRGVLFFNNDWYSLEETIKMRDYLSKLIAASGTTGNPRDDITSTKNEKRFIVRDHTYWYNTKSVLSSLKLTGCVGTSNRWWDWVPLANNQIHHKPTALVFDREELINRLEQLVKEQEAPVKFEVGDTVKVKPKALLRKYDGKPSGTGTGYHGASGGEGTVTTTDQESVIGVNNFYVLRTDCELVPASEPEKPMTTFEIGDLVRVSEHAQAFDNLDKKQTSRNTMAGKTGRITGSHLGLYYVEGWFVATEDMSPETTNVADDKEDDMDLPSFKVGDEVQVRKTAIACDVDGRMLGHTHNYAGESARISRIVNKEIVTVGNNFLHISDIETQEDKTSDSSVLANLVTRVEALEKQIKKPIEGKPFSAKLPTKSDTGLIIFYTGYYLPEFIKGVINAVLEEVDFKVKGTLLNVKAGVIYFEDRPYEGDSKAVAKEMENLLAPALDSFKDQNGNSIFEISMPRIKVRVSDLEKFVYLSWNEANQILTEILANGRSYCALYHTHFLKVGDKVSIVSNDTTNIASYSSFECGLKRALRLTV